MTKKSMKLGGGGRFQKMEKGLEKKGYSEESAKAITAAAGRKSMGTKRFQELAEKGKKRAAKKK